MKNIKSILLNSAIVVVAVVTLLGIVWAERHLPCWMYETAKAPVHCLPGGSK